MKANRKPYKLSIAEGVIPIVKQTPQGERIMHQIRWKQVDKDVKLGSVKNPSKVTHVKIDIPAYDDMGNIFGMLGSMFK